MQYELNVLDYWLIVKKRKYLILLTIVLVVGFSFALSQLLKATPMYEASARVKFERATTMSDMFLQSFSYYGFNDGNTQPEVIRSYAVIEEAAKRLGLVPDNATEEERKRKDYINTISNLRNQVVATPDQESSIIKISVTQDDPDEVARVANAVAESYRANNIMTRNGAVMASRTFVEKQLSELNDKLDDAEDNLRQFKEQEGQVFLNEEARMALQSFTQLELDYNKVTRLKQETARQVQALKKVELSAPGANRIFTETSDSLLASLNKNLVNLLQERTTLLIDYTEEHPQVVLIDRKVRNIKLEMLRVLVSKLKSFTSQENVLKNQIEAYRTRYLNFPRSAIQLSRLEREVEVNAELLAKLKVKYQELQIKSAERIEEVTIITPAVAPDGPINVQSIHTNLLVGALMGLFLGVVMAFTRESFDTSIGTIEGVEEFLKVPVLGVVPQFDDKQLRDAAMKSLPENTSKEVVGLFSKLPSLVDPTSVLAENLRSLRTNIRFARIDQSIKTIVFTSAGLGEGKSTTVINLAITLAQEGQKVLLVDADLRKPTVHKRLGLNRGPGLAEALTGAKKWDASVQGITDLLLGKMGIDQVMSLPNLDGLHVLTSGATPSNPGEVLNLEKLSGLIPEMQQEYDIVLFDTPPILPVTDAVTISSRTDGTILVYQVGRIGRSALRRVKFLLDHAQSTVLGVVLTNVRAEVSPEYGYSSYVYK